MKKHPHLFKVYVLSINIPYAFQWSSQKQLGMIELDITEISTIKKTKQNKKHTHKTPTIIKKKTPKKTRGKPSKPAPSIKSKEKEAQI